MIRISRALLIVLFAAAAAIAQTRTNDDGWPRKFAIGNNSVAVYQPQTEEWTGNRFAARAAIAITESAGEQPAVSGMAQQARSLPARAGSHITREPIPV